MRGSEKAGNITFEIHLESDHSSLPSTTSVPPSTFSYLYVSYRLPAPTLVPLLHRSQREPVKTKVKSCYLCAEVPFITWGVWGGGKSRVLTMACKALHGLPSLPYSLEDLISLTLLLAAHRAAATLASLLFFEQAKSTPTCRVFAPAICSLNPYSLCSNIPQRETFPVHPSKVTVPSPPWLLPSYCALFLFLAHLAS